MTATGLPHQSSDLLVGVELLRETGCFVLEVGSDLLLCEILLALMLRKSAEYAKAQKGKAMVPFSLTHVHLGHYLRRGLRNFEWLALTSNLL